MKNEGESLATRQRLLEAAGEIFAEQGFRCATVREICQRAGANIASINYHFGDKERLYCEVFRHAHEQALELHPYATPESEERPPEAQLEFFIGAFLQRIFNGERPAWHGRLMAREMAEPTNALWQVIDSSILPQFEKLTRIISGICPACHNPELIMLSARSILGQCLFYFFSQPVLERLSSDRMSDRLCVDRVAAHITRFSLIALRGLNAEACPANPSS